MNMAPALLWQTLKQANYSQGEAMTTETFIDVVKEVVRDASINSVETLLHQVPGRSPDKRLVALSAWHTALSDSDKQMGRPGHQRSGRRSRVWLFMRARWRERCGAR